jgi:hypothetical protein
MADSDQSGQARLFAGWLSAFEIAHTQEGIRQIELCSQGGRTVPLPSKTLG